MGEAEQVITAVVEQVRTLLASERVMGEPVTLGETTILPLVSVGFGFGGGSGIEGKSSGSANEGSGAGAGAGGGIRPVALVISDASGVRVEPIKEHSSSLAESIAQVVKVVAEEKSRSKSGKPTPEETGSDETANS
jgi:uncharacterized spore protein YtfJ